MANSFITVKNIARQALPILVDNLVMPMLAYRDYSNTFTDLGDTIQVRKPPVYEGKDFKVGDTVTIQDINEGSVDVTLDKIATVDIKLNAIEHATNMSEAKLIDDFINPAAVALAEKINKAGVGVYKDIPTIAGGTVGTAPADLEVFSTVRKMLNKAKAPLSERYAIWDVEADAKFTTIGNLVKVNEAGTNRALREGEIGRVFGLDNYMTQAIEPHTNGATGSPLVDGAATAGATTIHIDAATTPFTDGDMFTIAGDTTQYTVSKAGAVTGTNDQDLVITPALAKNAADNAAITLVAGATNNLAFHRNAIAFVTRPLAPAPGVESYSTSNGMFSLRVTKGYDMSTKEALMSMDVLYGYKVVYPELAVRYLG